MIFIFVVVVREFGSHGEMFREMVHGQLHLERWHEEGLEINSCDSINYHGCTFYDSDS